MKIEPKNFYECEINKEFDTDDFVKPDRLKRLERIYKILTNKINVSLFIVIIIALFISYCFNNSNVIQLILNCIFSMLSGLIISYTARLTSDYENSYNSFYRKKMQETKYFCTIPQVLKNCFLDNGDEYTEILDNISEEIAFVFSLIPEIYEIYGKYEKIDSKRYLSLRLLSDSIYVLSQFNFMKIIENNCDSRIYDDIINKSYEFSEKLKINIISLSRIVVNIMLTIKLGSKPEFDKIIYKFKEIELGDFYKMPKIIPVNNNQQFDLMMGCELLGFEYYGDFSSKLYRTTITKL